MEQGQEDRSRYDGTAQTIGRAIASARTSTIR
jgi:hypothetical protein